MRRLIIVILILFVLLITGSTVWAEYIGPQRTTITTVRDPSRDYWTCEKDNEPNCELRHPDNPCPDAGGSHPSVEQQLYWCGWEADFCGCNESYSETVHNLPPAEVAGTFGCSNPGNAGWCLDGAWLEFQASEPLSGESITIIEGESGLLCDPPDAPSVNCSWAGGHEGRYQVDFWAHSSYGDTSSRSGITWSLDSRPPEVRLQVAGGSAGNGHWYRGGPLRVTVVGSDSSSGFGGGEVALAAGTWQTELHIATEGEYPLQARGWDQAGRMASAQALVGYDVTPPTVQAVFDGAAGEHGWYRSYGQATVQTADELSGVAAVDHQVDASGWQSGPVLSVGTEGMHNLEWRVQDHAGNQTLSALQLAVDTQSPQSVIQEPDVGVELMSAGKVILRGYSEDSLSGLESVLLSIDGGAEWRSLPHDGGAWDFVWDTTRARNGVHVLQIRARDRAGNMEEPWSIQVRVDNGGPSIEIPASWYDREQVPMRVSDPGSGIREVKLTIMSSDFGSRRYRWDGAHVPGKFWWDRRFGEVVAPSGEYRVVVEAWDNLGNFSRRTAIIIVPVPVTSTAQPTLTCTTTPTPMRTAVRIRETTLPAGTVQSTASPAATIAIPVTGNSEKEAGRRAQSLPFFWLSSGGFFALLIAVGAAYISDRRYRAIWKLIRRMEDMNANGTRM